MTPIELLNIEEALEAAYLAGWEYREEQARQKAWATQSQGAANAEALTAQLKLVNAVGQAMNVNATLLQGLSASLDNVRVL